MKHVVKVFTKL
jgi:hypothetical protein